MHALLSSVECADGAVVRVTRIADPDDTRGVWWLVADYVRGDIDGAAYHNIRESERVALLVGVGLVVEHGGAR